MFHPMVRFVALAGALNLDFGDNNFVINSETSAMVQCELVCFDLHVDEFSSPIRICRNCLEMLEVQINMQEIRR